MEPQAKTEKRMVGDSRQVHGRRHYAKRKKRMLELEDENAGLRRKLEATSLRCWLLWAELTVARLRPRMEAEASPPASEVRSRRQPSTEQRTALRAESARRRRLLEQADMRHWLLWAELMVARLRPRMEVLRQTGG